MKRSMMLFAAGACAACATAAPVVETARSVIAAAPASGRFVLLRGADTIGTERFTRTASRLDADYSRAGQSLFRIGATLSPTSTVTALEITAGASMQTSRLTFSGDTAVLVQGSGDIAPVERRPGAGGAIPYVNPSPSLMEQITRRAVVLRAAQGGSGAVTVPVLAAGNATLTSATVTPVQPDSVQLQIGNVALRLRTDAAGSILGGTVPSQGLIVVRTP